MKGILVTFLLLISTQVWALDKEDSGLALQNALSKSNKDYNTHKKQMLGEENSRISSWGDRHVQAVAIDSELKVEARDFQSQPESQAKDTEPNEENPIIPEFNYEVSMN